MMNQDIIKKVISLVLEGYDSFLVFKKTNDLHDYNKAAKALELADATIYAATKPRYIATGEGWDLILVNSPSKDDLHPPTEDAILDWLKARSLA